MAALIARERALMAVEAAAHERLRVAHSRTRSAPSACARTSPLAPFTTFQVGGPAEWLIETRSERRDRRRRCASRTRRSVPVTLLGGGSNVLVSDAASAAW